jgi:hypothetical protein
MKTQTQIFYQESRKLSDANQAFMECIKNGLNKRELRQLIEKRPSVWGKFSNWLEGESLPE